MGNLSKINEEAISTEPKQIVQHKRAELNINHKNKETPAWTQGRPADTKKKKQKTWWKSKSRTKAQKPDRGKKKWNILPYPASETTKK